MEISCTDNTFKKFSYKRKFFKNGAITEERNGVYGGLSLRGRE